MMQLHRLLLRIFSIEGGAGKQPLAGKTKHRRFVLKWAEVYFQSKPPHKRRIVMQCEFVYCIFNRGYRCIFQEVEVDQYG